MKNSAKKKLVGTLAGAFVLSIAGAAAFNYYHAASNSEVGGFGLRGTYGGELIAFADAVTDETGTTDTEASTYTAYEAKGAFSTDYKYFLVVTGIDDVSAYDSPIGYYVNNERTETNTYYTGITYTTTSGAKKTVEMADIFGSDVSGMIVYEYEYDQTKDYTIKPFLTTKPTDDSQGTEICGKKKSVNDTTKAYRLYNGGFETGDLSGWTLSNSNLGGVNSAKTYWNEEIPFNNDGNFFNAYNFNGGAKEDATGALTSSSFTIGGSGWITYKLGGAKNADKVYLDVIEKDTGNILARYYNNAFSDDSESTTVRGCTLVAYKADLSAYIGKTVYIRIVDNAVSDYGLFFVDSFVTYYSGEPSAEGLTVAQAVTDRPATIYDIYNGGFESDLAGWTVSGGEIGAVTSDKGYWNDGDAESETNAYGQEGSKLFSWWSWDTENNKEVNREGNMGTLTSSMFVLKAGKYVSFKFGGGCDNRNVFIELVNADSGKIIAVFRNDSPSNGKLISYSYQNELSEDTLCYFRVVDNAVSGWGCFAADDFQVNLDVAPDGSITATNHLSDYASVVNGGFENGNTDGWTVSNGLGVVVGSETSQDWYQTNENTKEGTYLFTFYDGETNYEGGTGIVRSSSFILKQNGIISFRFGAAHNSEVYINVYTTGGKLLATFRNNAWTEDTVMVQYYYQFDNAEEISCYFEVVDNATSDYGCIVIDDFQVNLDSAPDGAALGSEKTKSELTVTEG